MTAYIAVDGNRIGSLLEALLVAEELESAAELSRNVTKAVRELEATITLCTGRVVFSGGDNILAEFWNGDEQFLIALGEELRATFEALTGCSASVGIGFRPRDAYLALKTAKGMPYANAITVLKLSIDERGS